MRRTAVEKADFIDKEYREYLRSSYSFGNDKYQDLYEKRLNEEVVLCQDLRQLKYLFF